MFAQKEGILYKHDCCMAKPPLTLIISLPRLIPYILNKSLYLTDLFINMVMLAGMTDQVTKLKKELQYKIGIAQ